MEIGLIYINFIIQLFNFVRRLIGFTGICAGFEVN